MPDCLGHIALLDIETEPFRAKYMIVGEALKKLLGADPTDQYLDTVYPKLISDEIYGAFKRSMDGRRAPFPARVSNLMKSFGYNRLILPMRLNGDRIRRILICIRRSIKSSNAQSSGSRLCWNWKRSTVAKHSMRPLGPIASATR